MWRLSNREVKQLHDSFMNKRLEIGGTSEPIRVSVRESADITRSASNLI